jgi:hypothetical protein
MLLSFDYQLYLYCITSEGINKEPRNQWLCNVVMRRIVFLFDGHQMAGFPFMDLVSITDQNKGTNCAQNNNRCYFIYCTLFSITLTNLANLTHWQLSAETFIQPFNFYIQGNRVARIDLTVSINIP